MDIQDDPALWFFPAHVGHLSTQNYSEMEFLRTQVATIEAYLERFPFAERESRALAWIEANASQYRHRWQAQAANGGSHMQ
ncbi:conserved hypothetical protein [Candidatus Accumulibacter aalborgensis]|uniref:Uncharacterized protein n=1 Tax=Candidatus Accumulibacter aalborgensis TaxID=1860102 RepID=A0A1A8XWU3_9PROT|nr:hypothetical protein [Candidatus Accumulibacter aalborgensis]SBT08483.1 conserved hypothetical protein [Candidatus Accumulibacter aalborgensis]